MLQKYLISNIARSANIQYPISNIRYLIFFIFLFFFIPSIAHGATQVYYSVGQNTTDHKTGSPTMTIYNGVATFSVPQTATNLGVGDKITYNTSSVAYISGKITTSQWKVVTNLGATPSNVDNATVNSIAHVFNSLSAAVNTSTGAGGASYLNNVNLTTLDVQLNIPCYYDTGADTTAVTINGYTTDSDNYIRVYTPTNTTTEANQSQRHNGKWDDTKYRLTTSSASSPLTVTDNNVRIDGIQAYNSATSSVRYGIQSAGDGSFDLVISNCIVRGSNNSGTDSSRGLRFASGATSGTIKLYNTVVYDWLGAATHGISQGDSNITLYAYNNTIQNNTIGINLTNANKAIIKNNLFTNCGTDAAGTYAAGTDYNATNNGAIGYTVTGTGNTHDRIAQTFAFIDEVNDDFHLTPADGGAKNYGVDLSADANISFSTDIDSGGRATGTAWDIGADELAATNVYYSVGQNSNDNKVAATLTLASGAGTFSAAQTGNIGVGDRVTYGQIDITTITDYSGTVSGTVQFTTSGAHNFQTGDYISLEGTTNYPGIFQITVIDATNFYVTATYVAEAGGASKLAGIASFISAKTNVDMTRWSLITPKGGTPRDVTTWTVNSIKHEYTSLSLAEADSTNASHLGSSDLTALNVVLNIPCYYDTGADTTATKIDGYTTGANNYIKVYTPINTTSEVNQNQRHDGTVDGGGYYVRYTLSNSYTYPIEILDHYVKVEGIKLFITNTQWPYASGIEIGNVIGSVVDSNIIIVESDVDAMELDASLIHINSNAATGVNEIKNNILINLSSQNIRRGIYVYKGFSSQNSQIKVLNNTIYGRWIVGGIVIDERAVQASGYETMIKNNVVYNSNSAIPAFLLLSEYNNTLSTFANNCSSDTTAGTANDNFQATLSEMGFVNVTAGQEDLRLQPRSVLVNAGADLSAYLQDDIDDHSRPTLGAWDIGADEATTAIYRSVAPDGDGNMGSIAAGSTYGGLSISGSTAMFDTPLPDNVGVGDALQYDSDSNGTIDAIAFIHERLSSTRYIIKKSDGTSPTATSGGLPDVDWGIFRAYTSLANAETGTENTGINAAVVNFDTWSGGKDLITVNQQWNIAAYANGTTADTTAVILGGWTTGYHNYIKVFTPIATSEVGTSQRHQGKWDDNKYKLVPAPNTHGIVISEAYVKLDGLQLSTSCDGTPGSYTRTVYIESVTEIASDTDINISSNIIKQEATYSDDDGIFITDNLKSKIWNNIIYGYSSASGEGIVQAWSNQAAAYVYNNTFYNNHISINAASGDILVKNNIIQGGTSAFYGNFNSNSGNNIKNTTLVWGNGTFGTQADSGTTTGTTSGKLVDSTQNFSTTVKVGMIIKNTTDNTYTYVTAVDSNTQLSVNDNIFTSGENYIIYTNKQGNVSFVDAANGDFHLVSTDILAKNQGLDLTSDTYLPITTDIDGQGRPTGASTWDIGADERNVNVYYSVSGGGDTATDRKTAATIQISSGVMIFSAAQTGNIGVGDEVIYGAGSKAYISGKIDQSNWRVTTATGDQPADVAAGTTLTSIKRVWSSLNTAVAGALGASYLTTGNLITAGVTLNIPCYYDTGADTTSADINGYTTGANNYIKVFTPNNTSSETNNSHRHSGKWDTNKYSLESGGNPVLKLTSGNIILDGVQVYMNSSSDRMVIQIIGDNATVRNSIIKNRGKTGNWQNRGIVIDANQITNYIYNNIIYDTVRGINWTYVTPTTYLYNNTVYNTVNAYQVEGSGVKVTAKNNIAQNNTNDFVGTFQPLSTHNISYDNTAPAYGTYYRNTTVQFVDAANRDFHLAYTDTAARDAGADLRYDINLPITDDIDGHAKGLSPEASGLSPYSPDIGADEGTIAIYRSVGPGATSAIDTGAADSNSLTISGSTATFSIAVPDNVGVGDVIQYDDDGDSDIDANDSIAFITARASSTSYTVKTYNGSTPTAVSGDTDWSIFRAYISLSNAEGGATENTGIDSDLRNFDTWGSLGGKDIFATNEQWNIAGYGDGEDTTASSGVAIDGWTTAKGNYIRVYVPDEESEVGASQRHRGVWDITKYRLVNNSLSDGWRLIRIYEDYVRFEGLQISSNDSGIGALSVNSNGEILIDKIISSQTGGG